MNTHVSEPTPEAETRASVRTHAKLSHLREYTRELKRLLPRHYFEPVPHRLLWVIPHLAIICVSILAVRYLSLSWLSLLAIAGVIGFSYACLGFLAHEILHGSVVKNPWVRNTVGGLCFLPFNLGPRLWRKWHNVEHHGHTQHDEDDPDAMGTLEDYRERKSLQRLYRLAPWLRSFVTFLSFTFWFSLHSGLMFRRYLPEFDRRERIIVIAQYVGPMLCWLALLVWIGPKGFLFAYVLPVLLANYLVMSYIATNHLLNPLTEINDPLANSLSVQVPRWVDVLHFNFSLHTEHHIFPAMNPKFAPKVRDLVKELWPDRYNEMPLWKAHLTLWRTPRLYRDSNSLVDPHRDIEYPALGHGLDPDNLQPRPMPEPEPQTSHHRLAPEPNA